ncbi:hypothetical protein NHX12_011528 [Muraenolepis orangiensis]|uniref:IBB domain-containing protein n=1 Tax=Muraenolepis orangiensis TaxID=630683 RepID=A0A9Q0DGC3_9TELE|nr:hypothetical protein NHX12_011528 [Muraenolepis orangiensis]
MSAGDRLTQFKNKGKDGKELRCRRPDDNVQQWRDILKRRYFINILDEFSLQEQDPNAQHWSVKEIVPSVNSQDLDHQLNHAGQHKAPLPGKPPAY